MAMLSDIVGGPCARGGPRASVSAAGVLPVPALFRSPTRRYSRQVVSPPEAPGATWPGPSDTAQGGPPDEEHRSALPARVAPEPAPVRAGRRPRAAADR